MSEHAAALRRRLCRTKSGLGASVKMGCDRICSGVVVYYCVKVVKYIRRREVGMGR